LKTSHCLRCSCMITSACTRGVAVAVRAITGTCTTKGGKSAAISLSGDVCVMYVGDDSLMHWFCPLGESVRFWQGCARIRPKQALTPNRTGSVTCRQTDRQTASAYLREACLEQAKPFVVWTEVMTPLQTGQTSYTRSNTSSPSDGHGLVTAWCTGKPYTQ
jgi:hypothetical protein